MLSYNFSLIFTLSFFQTGLPTCILVIPIDAVIYWFLANHLKTSWFKTKLFCSVHDFVIQGFKQGIVEVVGDA